MSNRFLVLAVICILLCIPAFPAIAESAATKPAATQANLIPWTVEVPNTNLKVTVTCPRSWKEAKYRSGQPFIYESDAAGELVARWEFDVKHGSKGRTIQQILTQIADGTAKRAGTVSIKKDFVDRPDGSKAGVIEYKSTMAGPEVTVREYFFALDDNTILVASEFAPSSQWIKHASELAKITDSIQVKTK